MTAGVYEGVDVLFETEVLVEGTGSLHYSEEVVVTTKEHVQAHLV